ncbi:hypothetical protein C8R47DRAFT_1037769 [Mycena vitilis]|nr:hypothetical protein C8R47DRAFT_1037769 [Mycena vitilis]
MALPPPPSGLVPLPPNVGSITSPQLIGTELNLFLFGTLFIQVYVYNLCFPKDRPAIKGLVYTVFAIMALCTCLNMADVHFWFGSGFGDIVKFGQARFSPFYTPIMGSVIALVVQLFFCYRISVFRSSATWLSYVIAVISFVQAAGGIGGGVKAFIASNEQHDQARTILVYMWLVGDAVADILIAVTMTYLLTQAAEPETRDIVRGVVRLIVETNTFSASVAIIGLALFAGMPGTDYFICPTMILPGIYANTLLVLLNNRAAPSRSHARADYVASSGDPGTRSFDPYASETTAHGTGTGGGSGNWNFKSAGPPTPTMQLGQLDYKYTPNRGGVGRRVPVPDAIPIGAFSAAPNPDVDDDVSMSVGGGGYRPSATGRQGQGQQRLGTGMVSEWNDDDTSYRNSYSDAKTVARWDGDGESLGPDAGDVETHPYGSAGTYNSWAR